YNSENQRLNRRNMNDTTPPHEMTHICKEDLYSRSASLVPNFAARWHLFCKHCFTTIIKPNTKQNKEPMVYKINPVTP
ncbi:MAG: hypothetical protein ACK53Y_16210, partial [bacterium]